GLRLAARLRSLLQAWRAALVEEVELPATAGLAARCRRRLGEDRLEDLPQLIAAGQAMALRGDAVLPRRRGHGRRLVGEVVARWRRRPAATRRLDDGGPGIDLRNRRRVGLRRAEVEAVRRARRRG